MYTLEVWTFLDHKMCRDVDVENSGLMQRQSIVESLQLMLTVDWPASV